MSFKTKLITLLLAMTLTLSLGIFNAGFPQSNESDDPDIAVELKLRELKEIDKETQEYPMMKDLIEQQRNKISELEKSLTTEQKTNELNQREIDLQKQVIALKDQEIAMKDRAFNDMKNVADRAIELAKVSKPNFLDTVAKVIVGVAAGIIIAVIAL